MKIRYLLCLFFLVPFSVLNAQEWKRDSIAVEFQIDQYLLDPFNGIYLSGRDGSIHNFDFSGRKGRSYEAGIREQVHNLSSPVSGRIGAFYKQRQLFVFLDRFLNESSRVEMRELLQDQVLYVVLGSSNILWLITNYGELVKYDLLIRKEVVRQNLGDEIQSFDKLQLAFEEHLVLIGADDELYILDEFGNFLESVQDINTDLKFYNSDMLISSPGGYKLYDIVEKEIRPVPQPEIETAKTKKVFVHRNRHFHFHKKYFDIYME